LCQPDALKGRRQTGWTKPLRVTLNFSSGEFNVSNARILGTLPVRRG
jgi:hypothetical protein